MKLWKHQQDLVDLAPDKHLLAFECGTGKTFTALELAKKSKYTLVICPKSLKEQWKEQMPEKMHILTKEEFKKHVDKIPPFDCLIIDEAHFFFGMTGARKMSGMLKALGEYINKHNPQKIYLLTATPYMSTPWNIFAAAKILGHKWKSKDFKEHFFDLVNMGMRWPVPVVKKGIEKDIADLVNKIGTTVKMEDCFDVPEQVFQTEYFDLTAEQKKAIKNLDEEGIARWTKTHQICGGTLKSDGYSEDTFYKSNKLNRLLELAQEHKKLVVVCRYNNEIDYIAKKLSTKSDIPIIKITGQTKERGKFIKMAEAYEQAIIIVNAACSEGYELPSFPIMVFYSYDFSLKNFIQMKGRILRANKLKKNVYLSLVVKNSIDSDVFECIQKKIDFDISIYNK